MPILSNDAAADKGKRRQKPAFWRHYSLDSYSLFIIHCFPKGNPAPRHRQAQGQAKAMLRFAHGNEGTGDGGGGLSQLGPRRVSADGQAIDPLPEGVIGSGAKKPLSKLPLDTVAVG